jgi:hypothetical protein
VAGGGQGGLASNRVSAPPRPPAPPLTILETTDAHAQTQQALQDALRALLVPLARLAVARGLPFAAVEGMLKQAFVEAASDAHPGLLAHRKVSRISTVTGINRREVTRLTQAAPVARPRGRSLASELFAHWLTDPRYRTAEGEPRPLPRQGPAPSFEALAQFITRDVHPRSLLDELLRLELARLDEASDTVVLSRHAVPRGDSVRMLGFLGENVGDHLRAAVDNVLDGGAAHFEQAIFADGVSPQTMEWVRQSIRNHWQTLLAAMVPELEQRIEADAKSEPPPERRMRIGLYSFEDPRATPTPPAQRPAVPRKRHPKEK